MSDHHQQGKRRTDGVCSTLRTPAFVGIWFYVRSVVTVSIYANPWLDRIQGIVGQETILVLVALDLHEISELFLLYFITLGIAQDWTPPYLDISSKCVRDNFRLSVYNIPQIFNLSTLCGRVSEEILSDPIFQLGEDSGLIPLEAKLLLDDGVS